jgi:predicted dehydrogenase
MDRNKSMAPQKIKWGILGTGVISVQFMEALQLDNHSTIFAICGRNLEKTKLLGSTFKVPHCFTDIKDLAFADLDVVYVATPTQLHFEHCKFLLESGCNVLCEKPISTTATEAKKLIEIATNQSRFFMEALWTRFIPAVRQVKSLIDTGKLGEIISFRAELGMAFDDSISSKFSQPNGGGALLDLGVYPISLALFFFGNIKEQCSYLSQNDSVDTSASIMLRHHNGVMSQLFTSIEITTKSCIEIHGTKASISLMEPLYRPYEMIYRESFKSLNGRVEDLLGWKAKIKFQLKRFQLVQSLLLKLLSGLNIIRQFKQKTVIPFKGNGYNYEIAEVVECITSNKVQSSLMPLSDSLSSLEIIENIKKNKGRFDNGKD